MSRLRLAVFDLDGVLVDSARAHFIAWKAVADDLGIPFQEADNEALKGVDRMGSLAAILALDGRTLPDADMARIAAAKNDRYLEAVAAMTPADLLPGAEALLDACADAGLILTVASASRNAPAVLSRTSIAHRFAHVADPARCRPKPAADLFSACARATGFDPSLAVGFEDAAAGIAAIRAARMRAIGIGSADVLAGADMVFPTTATVDATRVLA